MPFEIQTKSKTLKWQKNKPAAILAIFIYCGLNNGPNFEWFEHLNTGHKKSSLVFLMFPIFGSTVMRTSVTITIVNRDKRKHHLKQGTTLTQKGGC